MKVRFQAKLLLYLVNRKQFQGFTFIELLVVIIIITTLAVLALPAFLSCGNKSVQAEAKSYISSINRAQEAYFIENNTFESSLDKLGVGIKSETTNYRYSIVATKQSAFNYAIFRQDKSREYMRKSYVGGVFIVSLPKNVKNQNPTKSIICETKNPSYNKPANPYIQNSLVKCGADTIDLNR